jgi:CRP-like cAMP-binding protein
VLQHELTERLLLLRGVPVFRSMTSADLARVAETMETRTFSRGEIMLREDAPPRSMFLGVLGTVTMRRKGKRIGTVRAPGAVGFLSILARNAGGSEAVAESYVESYELTADVLDDIFEDHFQVLLGTIIWVAERLMVETREQPPQEFHPPPFPLEQMIGDRELGLVERIFLLRSTMVFDSANVNSVARLARAMDEVRVPAGKVIWEPGDPATGPYLIVKGMGRLLWNDDMAQQKVGPSYVVGGAESLVGVRRWNRFEMDGPGVLLKGSREALIDMFEDDHAAAMHFLSVAATGLMAFWDRKAEAGVTSIGSPDPPDSEQDDEDDDEDFGESEDRVPT